MKLLGLIGICVGLYICEATMYLGEFNSRYAVYMDYIITEKGRVWIDLLDSQGNIAIHVNPRYYSEGCSRSAMVFNNWVNKRWQSEVRPTGFPFPYNQKTLMVVVPEATRYRVIFDIGLKTYTYYFPYRNGHKPEQINRLRTQIHRQCSSKAFPKILNFGTGYHVSSLTVNSKIEIEGKAPSTGEMMIDISLGAPDKKDDVRVPLRIKADFSEKPFKMYMQSVVNDYVSSENILTNPIQAGQNFCLGIAIRSDKYEISVYEKVIGSFPYTPCSKHKGPYTIWVSGVTALDEIQVS